MEEKNLKFWKNLEISQKSQKKNYLEKKIWCKKKNAILLVFPIEEISLWPELCSPPRFRIKGGSPERDTRTNDQTNGNPRV